MIVIVAILLYTSLIFAIETEGPEAWRWSFYDSFWWGLMTLTTVGYDMNPSTFMGKFICGLCAVTGIFILTLPIPIVVNSFASYYKNRLWRNEVAYKKRTRARKRKEMEMLMRDNLLNILTVPGIFGVPNADASGLTLFSLALKTVVMGIIHCVNQGLFYQSPLNRNDLPM